MKSQPTFDRPPHKNIKFAIPIDQQNIQKNIGKTERERERGESKPKTCNCNITFKDQFHAISFPSLRAKTALRVEKNSFIHRSRPRHQQQLEKYI